MANFDLPRRGSAPAIALRMLQDLSGTARISAWMAAYGWRMSQLGFCSNMVDRLERAGLISVEADLCTVTKEGRQFLGVTDDFSPAPPPVPVGPRYVPPMRPLTLAKHFPPRLHRPDGTEYQTIPSRMGEERIAYKGIGTLTGVAG